MNFLLSLCLFLLRSHLWPYVSNASINIFAIVSFRTHFLQQKVKFQWLKHSGLFVKKLRNCRFRGGTGFGVGWFTCLNMSQWFKCFPSLLCYPQNFIMAVGWVPGGTWYVFLLLFSCSAVSDSLRPRGLQHTRLPRLSPSPGACSSSRPLSRWFHPTMVCVLLC